MKKNLLIITSTTIIILIWLIIVFLFLGKNDNNKNIKDNTKYSSWIVINEKLEKIIDNTNNDIKEKEEDDNQNEKNIKTSENKSNNKKRFSIRWIVLKWDFYLQNNHPTLALAKYISAHKRNEDDEKIIAKIAETYQSLKNFNNAKTYYQKIKDNSLYTQKYIENLFYDANLEDKEQFNYIANEINKLKIDSNDKIYYINSLYCLKKLDKCKENFRKEIDILTWSWIDISWTKMENIKNAIEKYDNFKVKNSYYEDSLVIWSLYENKLYPITSELWEKILDKKPWYKAMLLIVWKSYYELWKYKKAKEKFESYYELEANTPNIAYLLGNINYELKDYISSNLYYNAAIKNWYKNKIDLKRKLIYNYHLLWDQNGMMKVFTFLIEEDDYEIDDISLAIYHAIINKKVLKAISWANSAIKKYPEEEIFYWYLWWIYREEWDYKKSEKYLKKWLKMNLRNPMICLNYWYLLELKEEYKKALIYFKRTVSANKEWEFWELAKKEIEIIESYIKELEKLENKD